MSRRLRLSGSNTKLNTEREQIFKVMVLPVFSRWNCAWCDAWWGEALDL